MKSRRRIVHPKARDYADFPERDYSRDLRPAKWGPTRHFVCSIPQEMSALCQKQTSGCFYSIPLSALAEERRWTGKAKCFRRVV
jgi:hypothetical protein